MSYSINSYTDKKNLSYIMHASISIFWINFPFNLQHLKQYSLSIGYIFFTHWWRNIGRRNHVKLLIELNLSLTDLCIICIMLLLSINTWSFWVGLFHWSKLNWRGIWSSILHRLFHALLQTDLRDQDNNSVQKRCHKNKKLTKSSFRFMLS